MGGTIQRGADEVGARSRRPLPVACAEVKEQIDKRTQDNRIISINESLGIWNEKRCKNG
jgi:hypothetical protein